LAGANIEGNSLPTPGIDLQLQRGKSLRLRSFLHSPLFAIAAKLAAHQVLLVDRSDRPQHLYFLVADALAVSPDRLFHRQTAQHLKQVVLNDVTNGAGPVIESSSPLDPEVFGHRDLNTVDVVTVPERLNECVCKAKNKHVVHRPFSQVVVDAE